MINPPELSTLRIEIDDSVATLTLDRPDAFNAMSPELIGELGVAMAWFADQGEFRTSDLEMIMNKASCLSLLSNAVVLWNTLQIERIVTELRAGGMTIRDEDLVHVWPLQRRHITPNGVYFANRTMPAFVLPDPVEA